VSVAVAPALAGQRGVTTSSEPGVAVTLNRVSRSFETASGPVVAVEDFSLRVDPGEFLVIVGPSGCGKTTLLRIIADLEQPTHGEIAFEPEGEISRRNAMVFQGRSVFPWLTVEQNVAYGLKVAGTPRRERRSTTANLLSLIGLTRFANAYPHQISEGMRQRVAIARALAVEPQLLLMDEPFGALDEQTRFLLQEELLRIWDQTRKTVVLVTHSIDEALTLADRIVIMTAHPGRIKSIVPVPFSRPRNLETVRSDPRFARLFAEIWESLRTEVQRARLEAGEIVR
jgi:NitT/TauT family transport system ATP-binding protein